MKKILIVTPAFNEDQSIISFIDDLLIYTSKQQKLKFDIMVIDDGSTDNTWDLIKKKKRKIKNLFAISLTKNFGKEAAISAGINEFEYYDALITIDSDYQFPINCIEKMTELWREGGEIIIGLKKNNKDKNLIKKLTSKIFHLFSNFIFNKNHVRGMSDYLLLDAKVVKQLKNFKEKNRVIRSLIDTIGFKKKYFEFNVENRKAGGSKYSFSKLFKIFLNILIQYSTLIYKFIFYLSLIIFFIIFIIIMFTLYQYFNGNYLSTSPTAILIMINSLVLSLVFFISLVSLLLLRSINIEVKNRPIYLIREKI